MDSRYRVAERIEELADALVMEADCDPDKFRRDSMNDARLHIAYDLRELADRWRKEQG